MVDREVIGMDVGSARTKVVRARDGAAWEGGTPSVGYAAFLRTLLSPNGQFPIPTEQTTAVVAAPDRWRVGGATPVPLGDTSAGAEWVRALTEDAGIAQVRLVPGLQCVAAAQLHADPEPGCVLVCDVGATTIDAALYSWDGHTTWLLDAEHAGVSYDDPDSLLLEEITEPTDDTDRPVPDPLAVLRALAEERYAHSRRITLVVERAREQDRYQDTPVCLPGRFPPIPARAVDAALRPVAATAATVVRRLVERIEDTPRPELVVTGGNALGPVATAVREAAGDLVTDVRVVAPITTARGAALIGQGVVGAADSYPHRLGIPARQVRDGWLESVVLPLDAAMPRTVELPDHHRGPLPVAVRLDDDGPWLTAAPVDPVDVAPGRHQVTPALHRAGLGGVVVRHEDSGMEIVQMLAARPGDAIALARTQEMR